MSDPLSTPVGVVGLIGFTIQVTQILTNCYNSYKDQDTDRARTLQNLEHLSVTLRSLEEVIQNHHSHGNKEQSRLIIVQYMRTCFESIKELENQWGNVAKSPFRRQLQRLTYPIRKNRLAELYGYLAQIRANLSLELLRLQFEWSEQQRLQWDEQQRLRLKEENAKRFKATLRWLNAPYTKSTFDSYRQKHHAGTGEWFVNGDEFSNWLKTPNSFLWVHGVPGCGKSVLFSTAIHHIAQVDKDAGLAFFYFDFKDSLKQSAEGMLRALLSQLLLQENENDREKDLDHLNSPYEVEGFPLDDLIACLHRIAQRFSNIYILLDALNECPRHQKRTGVLATITTMREWDLPALHVLVTSHDVFDIRQSLNPQAGQEVTMKNPGVDKDIDNYVYYQLTTDPGLHQWKSDRAEIHAALTERAQGV